MSRIGAGCLPLIGNLEARYKPLSPEAAALQLVFHLLFINEIFRLKNET
jgi:hypothetical protein